MAINPKDVKRKLDDLYWKTDEIRKDLIALHGMLSQSNFFEEKETALKTPPPQSFQPPVPPPQYVAPPPQILTPPPVVPPVVPPPVIPPQPIVPPVIPPVAKPQEKVYEHRKPQPVPAPQPKYAQPAPSVPKEPEKGFFERNPDLEKFIGERLVTFIGIAVLVTGIAFFVKYAIDKNWINEIGRTAIGILCGGILLGFAHRLRKSFTAFSSVLVGGGISVLYFTISYAYQVYELFPQAVAFGILVVITGFTVLLSIAYDRKELAILAIVGGFVTPLMVSNGQGNFNVLCTYMLILDLGMLALAWYKKWNVVNIVSYIFTILLFAGALTKDIQDQPAPHYTSAFIFSTLLYLTFFLMNVVNNVKNKKAFQAGEIIILLSNTFLYFGCGYYILHAMGNDIYQGLFTLLVAVFNFVFAFALFRRQEVDKLLVYFLIGLVITFVSLAGPIQLHGNHITLFWAAEAALLLWLWQRSEVQLIKVASGIINLLMLFSLAYNWLDVYGMHLETGNSMAPEPILPVLLNKAFVTAICVAVSLVVSSLLLKKEKAEMFTTNWETNSYRKLINIGVVFLLFIAGLFELLYQLHAHDSMTAANAIYISGYVTLYVLAAWLLAPLLGMKFMQDTLAAIGVLLMIVTGMAMHYFTIQLRTHALVYAPGDNGAYLFHYLNLAAVLALTFFIGKSMYGTDRIEKQLRNTFLTITCIMIVFIVSTEIDNTLVFARFDSTIDVVNNPVAAVQHISAVASQSQKIGYPIAWGLISFAMIILGMKRKVRLLRILALALFALTVGKLIFLGIYGESQAGKIVAFILSGVILLLVSFMYQKLKKIILEDESSNTKKDNHEPIA